MYLYNRKINKNRADEETEKQKQMEECMRESMRKLALWYTRTFKPIMTHDELDPIMATLGFISSPSSSSSPPTLPPPNGTASAWKEYVYSAGGCWCRSPSDRLPRPRLPYPRIDGLHIYTYRAFIDAVNFYLEMTDISDLFHIRGMPLHRIHDRSKKWRRMEEDDSVFVYREGTVDQATYNFYHLNKNSNSGEVHNSTIIRKRSDNTPISSCLVSLKDIIL